MFSTTDFTLRFGLDKLTHLGWGGWICAMLTLVAVVAFGGTPWWGKLLMWAGATAVTFVAAVVKERLDERFEWADIAWTMVGTLFVLAALAIALSVEALVG